MTIVALLARLLAFRLLNRPLLWLYMHTWRWLRLRRQVQRLAFWLAVQERRPLS